MGFLDDKQKERITEFVKFVKGELELMFAQDQDRKFMQDVEKKLVETASPKLPENFCGEGCLY